MENSAHSFTEGSDAGKDTAQGNPIDTKVSVSYKHSGNTGDIIYALAGMRQKFEQKGWKANLHIWLDRKGFYYEGAQHPLGGVTMNQHMYDMLKPLLESQDFINSVRPFQGEPIHVDMDLIRQRDINMPYGHIARWYFYLWPDLACDLSRPWLHVKEMPDFNECIIVNRTSRYRNPHISYSFLRYYANVLFVGTDEEYNSFQKEVPNCSHLLVRDFYELASVIWSSMLFIGNQSMCYALAEATKANRLVELCSFAPNVIPEGANGNDFYSQQAFEYYVERFCGKRLAHMPSGKPREDQELLQYISFEVLQKVAANTLVDYPRLLQLAKFVKQTEGLNGVIAEVGVYKGGTALLMTSITEKMMMLFDTFEGMPEVTEHDLHHKGDFSDTSLEHVKSIVGIIGVFYYKGIFPQSYPAKSESIRFSLVHIDVDIYQSVKDCLEFFYPRMVQGGIIVLDDVLEPNCPGAKKAFSEFMIDKPEYEHMTCQSQVAFIKI